MMKIKKTTRFLRKITGPGLLLLLLLHVLAPYPGLLYSGEKQKNKKGLEYREAVNDGPYIFRKDDHVVVYHIHNNRKITTEYRIKMNGPRYKSRFFTVKIPAFKKKYTIPTAFPVPEPELYGKVKKIFVISDLHGQLKWFKKLLVKNKIVTKKMRWRWGKGHLVILGDIFDRGPDVTEALWLVHQLEQQAKRKGGRVHFLLGNHEMMVLKGDLRYLHPKYTHASEHILKTPITVLYGPHSMLGQWLRTKHTVIRINDLLFVHGGIHPEVLSRELDIKTINQTIRNNLDTPRETRKADALLNFLFFRNGPLWYRGYFPDEKKYEQLEPGEIQRILDYFKAKHIIVGHTTQKHITPSYNKKIFAVDSGLKYGNRGEALLWRKGKFYMATETGKHAFE